MDSKEWKEAGRQLINYESDPAYDPDCLDKQGIFTKDYDPTEELKTDESDRDYAAELADLMRPRDQHGWILERSTDGVKPPGDCHNNTTHEFITYTGLGNKNETVCKKCGKTK